MNILSWIPYMLSWNLTKLDVPSTKNTDFLYSGKDNKTIWIDIKAKKVTKILYTKLSFHIASV